MFRGVLDATVFAAAIKRYGLGDAGARRLPLRDRAGERRAAIRPPSMQQAMHFGVIVRRITMTIPGNTRRRGSSRTLSHRSSGRASTRCLEFAQSGPVRFDTRFVPAAFQRRLISLTIISCLKD